ncbi:DoxX family protein [Brevibacillus ruminantium]
MGTGGLIKIARVPFQVEHWSHYQYPLLFMTVVGLLELIGAVALAGGFWNKSLAVAAGVLFIPLMLGAIHAHLFRARQPIMTILPSLLTLLFSVLVIYCNLTTLT